MQSFPFNSVNGDRLYSAEHFQAYLRCFFTCGVFVEPADGMMVMADGDMTVRIKPGRCFINGCTGEAFGDDRAELIEGDGLYPRYDLVCARLDMNTRDIHIVVIDGEPAEEPVYPVIKRTEGEYDLALAAVYVDPDATEITQVEIRDLRMYDEYCGIVSNANGHITTGELFAQYQAIWDKFIKGLLAGEGIEFPGGGGSEKVVKNILAGRTIQEMTEFV